MSANNCNCVELVNKLRINYKNPKEHIKELIDCCRISLEPCHGSEIGDTLCSKKLIEYLYELYSSVDCSTANSEYEQLMPLEIFDVIRGEFIGDCIIISNSDSNLEAVRREFVPSNKSKLNQILITKIRDYRANLKKDDHNIKVTIYHLMILYIHASNLRPPNPEDVFTRVSRRFMGM